MHDAEMRLSGLASAPQAQQHFLSSSITSISCVPDHASLLATGACCCACNQVLRPFVMRRTKAEVEAELPAKTEFQLLCQMSAWQALWYRQLAEQARAH